MNGITGRLSAKSASRCFVVAMGLLVSSLISCGPSLGNLIEVPSLNIAKKLNPTVRLTNNTFLSVDEFTDTRPSPTIAVVDGKKDVKTTGEVLPVVVSGLKDSLGNAGFTFSDSAPVIIAGEVRKWSAEVQGRLPTKLSAEGQLYLEVFDPANKKIYSGVYNGFSSMESSSITEADLKRTLSGAMEETIRQIMADRQLLALLQSY